MIAQTAKQYFGQLSRLVMVLDESGSLLGKAALFLVLLMSVCHNTNSSPFPCKCLFSQSSLYFCHPPFYASFLPTGVGFQGGYIAGNIKMTEAVRHRARGFVFTSTLTPGTAAAGLMALRLVQGQEGKDLREKLFHNVHYVRRRLTEEGIPTIANRTHIIPVKVGGTL